MSRGGFSKQRGREGVNPSPEGRGILGRRILWEGMPLNHLSPRGLVGLVKIGSKESQALEIYHTRRR